MSTSPVFDPAVEARHRRVDADAWSDIYAIGDVHGCRRELESLLARIDPGPDDLVVFVGDLVRKGPDGAGVVDIVRSRSNFLAVRGNNEEKLLRGEAASGGLTPDDLDWLASLPVVVSWEGTLVVHAGVDPRKPLRSQTVDDLQTVRSLHPDGGYRPPFWFDEYVGPRRVIFGHTPLDAPLRRPHAIGLDTGCVYGGALTAYDCRRDRTLTLDSDRTVQERDPDDFVTPANLPAVSE
ncbi:MAG: metallophosphoesterase family protein [Haloferacaceae archaeon]